ncbi:DinB family protein [Roseivirga sp. E12]|uniref:DinB family protein n=1 Tax=Roseivirga sp. E12 TaxID=2819237 RepID=UPI001ABC5D5B|nr:DinB family protein [Roseivirga sp. E12]MBO3697397.1 hypothetical protein [Roseivirga sp. E12]
MKNKKYYLMMLVGLMSINLATAQNLKVDRMVFAWSNMKNMVVNTAKALPEDKWDFVINDKILAFGDMVKHVSTSTRFFTGSLAGRNQEIQELNAKTNQLKSKEEIIKDLEEAFDFAIASIKKVENWDEVINAFGNEVSRLEMLLQGEHHMHREHGKIIVMMRMNGIAPAKSTSWFL